ncbi:pectinesterase inhibitor 1 [Cajanus cajan]|uniref:Pectinesterase inhibitor 1 n=1 Tax=Cajanus cajan TaxID=3821 RepID=A0A151S0A0_CAJCA|nr:pectinesterase inhibitor 1 [Cajanus cajan]KYP48228.1 Pectinesterase inhibitor 1 [Cajanus cajan]
MVFFSFGVSSFPPTKVVDVKTICKLSKNTSFCLNFLNSKPGGAHGANLDTLGQYTFNQTLGKVTNTITLIKQLIAKGSPDPLKVFHYKYCMGSFIRVKSDIEYVQSMFKSKDYRNIRLVVEDSLNSSLNCLQVPPENDDPSMLPKYIKAIQLVEGVIRAILVLLGI